MLIVLIASVAIGLGAAGLVLTLPKLTGRSLPRWAAPAAGGIAMFSFMLWNEYSWYERAVASLPEGSEVAEAYPYSSIFQPWTLAVPRVARFAAVGPATTIEGTDLDLSIATVLLIERLEPAQNVLQLFDCAGGRRADLPEPAEGEALRLPAEPRWVEAGQDDPLIRAACKSRHPEETEEADGEVGTSG